MARDPVQRSIRKVSQDWTGIAPLATVLVLAWPAPAHAQMTSERLGHEGSPRERIELRKERYDKSEIDELCRGANPADTATYDRTVPARFCITPAGSCRDPAAAPGASCACFTPAGVFLGMAR